METTDLANSIGLATRQEAAFKGMPLTNFANKEYQINANNAKLEAERQRKEAELEKQLMSKINVTGKFDKISAPKIQKAYASMVMNKGYKNPEMLYQFDVQKQNEELASAARKEQSDLLNKTDLLIDPKIKTALINHDVNQLEVLSKDPNSGIVKDERLPDTYTLAPEARIPRVDNITMVAKKFVPTDEAALDRGQTKLLKTVGGKNIYGTPVKDAVLNQSAVEFLSNPVNAKNWLAVHQEEIGKEVAKGVPLQEALVNNFKEKNRFIETDTYTPSKGGNKNKYWVNNDNSLQTSSGWKLTPNGEKGWLVNNVSPSGVGAQLIRVITPPEPIINPVTQQQAVNREGKPLFKQGVEVDERLTPTNINYLGDDKWEIEAEDKDKDPVVYQATTQSLKSVIDNNLIEDIKKNSGNKSYTSKFVKTSEVKKETPKAAETTSKLDKALAAFEKQVGRKPTATELEKIKQKYK